MAKENLNPKQRGRGGRKKIQKQRNYVRETLALERMTVLLLYL